MLFFYLIHRLPLLVPIVPRQGALPGPSAINQQAFLVSHKSPGLEHVSVDWCAFVSVETEQWLLPSLALFSAGDTRTCSRFLSSSLVNIARHLNNNIHKYSHRVPCQFSFFFYCVSGFFSSSGPSPYTRLPRNCTQSHILWIGRCFQLLFIITTHTPTHPRITTKTATLPPAILARIAFIKLS